MADRTRTTTSTRPKGDDRRVAILAALEELLAEQRFSDVQIAEIARRAGVTRSGFYFYFPTKAACVAALLTEVAAELMDAASGWYERKGDPRQALAEGFRANVALWREHAALFTAMLDATAVDADAAALWETFFDGFRERVAERIKAEIDMDPAGAPPADDLASVLTSMAFHMMERDVRSVLRTGRGLPETEVGLVFVYDRLIYGRSSGGSARSGR
jgi:AcrR family transcriptional regulator